MQTVCVFGQHSQELLADNGCHHPLCFAMTPPGIFDQSSKSGGCSSVRGECKLLQCVFGRHSQELLANNGCRLPLCSAPQSSGITPTSRARLRLHFGARRMQTVCMHSHELLLNTGCRLPLCSAMKPSGIFDQSSKLGATRRCNAVRDGCKLFAVLASTRKSCLLTKAAAFLFALHRCRQGSL